MPANAEPSAKLVSADASLAPAAPITDTLAPSENDALPASSSQVTLPSTEAPGSPADGVRLLKMEAHDDHIAAAAVIRSSLTPPPSSQIPAIGGGAAGHAPNYIGSQPSGIFSPPATARAYVARDSMVSSEYTPPTPQQVVAASPDELRSLLQASIAEHAKLKMEAAHHKLQYNLLSLQADEDAKRAAVEHEMTRREVDVLREADHSRYARRELSTVSESAHVKYLQFKTWYDLVVEENDLLARRLNLAKKVIQQKEDDIFGLTEERDMLLNRIRENREHFHLLCSPGGIFHAALTPKTQAAPSPAQHRATPRHTPRSTNRDRDHGQEPFDVLLKAATQENSSAPTTPVAGCKSSPRNQPKHTRNVQSMSSIPTTPTPRSRDSRPGLLPPAHLVPQSEPPYRHSRYVPETPTSAPQHQRRSSRESTISAGDNEELARQALSSLTSRDPHRAPASAPHHRPGDDVFESQASQAALEMLRRAPRGSYEAVGAAADLRGGDAPPAAAERSAKLQAKLFAGLNKGGVEHGEKRKLSGDGEAEDKRCQREALESPTKRLRMAGGLRDPVRVGLGIRYGREAI